MRSRSTPILLAGFGSLVILIAMAGLGAARRATQIQAEMAAIYEQHREITRLLNEVGSAVNVSGVLVRDYLLDQSHLTAEAHRRELRRIRSEMGENLRRLQMLVTPDNRPKMEKLREELEAYWEALDPLFDWNPSQKMALSGFFLRQTVLPRREAAMGIAREIEQFSEANLQLQRQRIRERQQAFVRHMGWMLGIIVMLGLGVAGFSVLRIVRLEQRSQEHQARTERAETELRRLSQELVRAQEVERKHIARELHDAVGQTLTALKMELSHLGRLYDSDREEYWRRLEEAKKLAEQTLATVRSISMGLRPAMLDDLGLGPALEWQSREFYKRTGIPVDLQMDGRLDGLPEAHRTAIFRIVQEALTNCARHSRARHVRVTVHGREDALYVSVQDDGVGMEREPGARNGIGLVGIEERARELGGRMNLFSQPGKGTTLTVEIPMQTEART